MDCYAPFGRRGAPQRWTREKPTEPGWYWYREELDAQPALYPVEWKPVWKCWGIPGKRVDEMLGEWQGPLTPNEATETSSRRSTNAGKQLQTIRAKLGLTQPELAKLLSVHWSTVARWEQGVYPIAPAMATLIRLVAKQKEGANGK